MILVADHINLNFDRPVLKDVSFKLKEGQILSIVGKSGAGKTSLLKILSGLLSPDSGTVYFEGERVKGPHEKLMPGHEEICLVNQDFRLDDYHTVEENIRLKILHLKDKVRDRFTHELIELMGLGLVRNQQAITLSGGEQQRLAIARVLAMEPRVILLDEPFSHLDADLRSRLTDYMLELRRIRQTSFVLVSHDGAEVLGLSDEVYFMKNGKLQRKGVPETVYYNYKTLEEARIFGPVNSIRWNGNRISFRPNEFEIVDEKEKDSIHVIFVEEAFTGPVYENYFKTMEGEKIILYSFNSLKDVKYIRIKREAN